MKTTTTLLTLTGLLCASAFAYRAHAASAEHRPDRAFFAEKLAALDVTDTQKQQVRTILRQHQPTAGPLLKQLVAERRQLRTTIRAGTVDEPAIRAQAAKVASLEADLAVERAHIVHAIKPVLTPEQ
ncbi:MAG: Spy/CpxP family protein refolding chaperone, partial [Verrucomicrobiota bacterium]